MGPSKRKNADDYLKKKFSHICTQKPWGGETQWFSTQKKTAFSTKSKNSQNTVRRQTGHRYKGRRQVLVKTGSSFARKKLPTGQIRPSSLPCLTELGGVQGSGHQHDGHSLECVHQRQLLAGVAPVKLREVGRQLSHGGQEGLAGSLPSHPPAPRLCRNVW